MDKVRWLREFVCYIIVFSFEAALGFVFNEVIYPNGSTVLRTDIQEGDAALNCITDSTTCCTNQNGETRAGEFYFPNGSWVPNSINAPSNSYYRTRSSRLISLNRRPTATQTGQFRCEIPAAIGTLVNLIINISMLCYSTRLLIMKKINSLQLTSPSPSLPLVLTLLGRPTAWSVLLL